jgi:hypothetical protein
MFIFVVPLKGRASSSNWRVTAELCERAITSMLANPSPDVRVILVCNEIPGHLPVDPRLTVRSIVTPIPKDKSEMMADKFIKFKTGLVLAREFAPGWLMRADADDLISSKLVSFIHDQVPGQFWYSEVGWRHQLGSRFVIKQNRFHLYCGTSHLAYVTQADLPGSIDSRAEDCYLLTQAHNVIVDSRKAAGVEVRPIPFPTTVYILNSGENWSGTWLRTNHDRRTRLKLIFNTRPITQNFRREFGLWPI